MQFNNRYAKQMAGHYAEQPPMGLSQPQLVCYNDELANFLGLDNQLISKDDFLQVFSGNKLIEGMQPLAQKYTGHQFGQYNPLLGDGRGLLLGEAIASDGLTWDLHLKGAGPTPYSRGADGRAVLRSSIREFLASEAMYHLGIPTSRALALTVGDNPVYRETQEQAAMLTRVCRSHIRFGHFEYLFHTKQGDALKQLVDFTIEQYFPGCLNADKPILAFFEQVIKDTANLIAKWQSVGFCHGVMNSDNMSILGLTFDYGPYAFLDAYQEDFICNHSDHTGRYAFNRQPSIALWNLNCLAHALSELLSIDELRAALQQYEPQFIKYYSQNMQAKLGLTQFESSDKTLLGQLLDLMQVEQLDFTNTFRLLSESPEQEKLLAWFGATEQSTEWVNAYLHRVTQQDLPQAERLTQMQQVNPKYVLRNYLAQNVIEAAEKGDFTPVNELYQVLKQPFISQSGKADYAQTPPQWAKELAISCSS
ncbi:protein adenylyltransferase SelO [Catenovulum adriaticum]|uniref:Protein nucleotidyltransferase YdiU n=1 Tax=Catenovulum adriaticum TaxID=2984846 RepID=A0ABY7AMR9_9ALTE|nr:YdiU family protein [Catenovulum sp. TS8]WAJ70848.1 YdiU family protein [Catenovulum sp. TS8]